MSENLKHDYDVVIVGGGLVGGSLACALGGMRLKVAMIEAVPANAEHQPSYDDRVIALSLGSRRIFGAIRVWPDIEPQAEPILRVHVSDRGHCGFSRLDHAEEGVEALGYVAPARAMGRAIHATLQYAPNLEVHSPARLLSHGVEGDWMALEVTGEDGPRRLRARLLVAADGGDSAIRDRLGLDVREYAYGQDAVIAKITPDRPRRGMAYERFTDTGPLAMLPMIGGHYSLVWTCRSDETAGILALSDEAFLERLQGRFGYRLGRLTHTGPRFAYPLKLSLTRDPVQERLVLIGNAAHRLHPVAGQGFNLGLRDVAALAEVLADCAERGLDPGGQTVLRDYRRWRGSDHLVTARSTDVLARLFPPQWPPLVGVRDLGMLGLELFAPARHLLAKRFMGLGGRLPRLACGLSLEQRHV